MALHTLNRPPGDLLCFERCLQALDSGDALLLIEDGVYAALDAHNQRFMTLPPDVTLYALQPDLSARGLTCGLNSAIRALDDAGFVALACAQDKVISWF